MPPVVIIVQFPQQGHKSPSLTQQVYSNSLPDGITLSWFKDPSQSIALNLRSHVRETCQSKSQLRIHSGPVSDRYEVYSGKPFRAYTRLYGLCLYQLMQAISGIQIVERERKIRGQVIRDFLLLFFSNRVKTLHFNMVVFFFFWFRVFVNEFNNYFVQNVYYITLQL